MTESLAVVIARPEQLELRPLALTPAEDHDVLVDVEWTGISTGTERLLYRGQMPPFPGMGYPLVPGYETVGRVVDPGRARSLSEGDRVFVPGANCFGDVRGLFGGSASRLRVPEARVTRLGPEFGEEFGPQSGEGHQVCGPEQGILLALAATARHALHGGDGRLPELIVGHGVLGRLMARLCMATGVTPTVWETNPRRMAGATDYSVIDPEDDPRRDYRCICDVSGDASILEALLGRLARGGEIILAGFYSQRIAFDFPLAFVKEARLRVAAEWAPEDLQAAVHLVSSGHLDLRGLITHRRPFDQVADAYVTAFDDPDCLKMCVDWRTAHDRRC
ncbi:MAG: chlorophyll synthesis pathway protein BchC [Myxococcota bacterium]